MTDLTGPLVLPASLRLVPVRELAPEIRVRLGGEPEDVALTDPGSRTPSRLVGAEGASLLELFRAPARIVEAVFRFSRERGLDPGAVLEEVYPLLRRLVDEGLLVEPGGAEALGTEGTLRRGDRFGGFEVFAPLHATEDSELVQARGSRGVVALKVERRRGEAPPTQSLDYEAAVLEHLAGSVAPRLLARGGESREGQDGRAGRPWLALEWVRGVDAERAAREIRTLLDDARCARRAALFRLAQSLFEAYASLHERGVVHGDVHPGNVLVAPDGAVRLLDFGVAAFSRVPADLIDLAAPPRGGVAFYYEPECARAMLEGGAPLPPSFAGEQYSVAALIYFLLSGAHYCDFSLTREAMLRQIAEQPPRAFAALGLEPWPEAEAILARALAKAPAERYPSFSDLARAWREARPSAPPGEPAAGSESGGDPSAALGETYAGAARLRLLGRARFVGRALARLRIGGEAFALGSPPPPSASVFFGAAGVSLALLHLAKAGGDGALLALADHWAAKAAQRAATPGAWHAEERGLDRQLVEAASPFHGASGIAAVEAQLARALGEPELEAAALARFAGLARRPWRSLDLTLGASGALLVASDLLPGAPSAARLDLASLGSELCERIWSELAAHPPVGEDPGVPNLGVAHGWAGLLYAGLRWCRAAGLPPPEHLQERLRQLGALAEPWGRGLRWRCLGEDGRDLGALSGWCNGSAGFVFLWDEALRHLPEPDFAELHEGAAWHAWEGPDEGPDLCCGIAGRSYALLSLFRRTGEVAWLGRAEALAERAAREALRQDDAPDSLFKGGLGVAVLGVDLEHPEAAAFPCFEEAR